MTEKERLWRESNLSRVVRLSIIFVVQKNSGETVLKKIKEAVFNTIETYVPWSWHEREMPNHIDDYSKFDFTDLVTWLKIISYRFEPKLTA